MNLTDFIIQVRYVLDDPSDAVNNPQQTYSDQMLVSIASQHVQSLARIQAQRDQGFHNFMLAVKNADAKQIVSGCMQWSLPPWIMNISNLRVITTGTSDATQTPTFSPYKWASALSLGDSMPKKSKHGDYGWDWDGNRTLRLWNFSTVADLLLDVAKLPPRLFKATLDQDAADEGELYLPSSLTLGTEDLIEGGYINSEVQVTSLSDTSANVESIGVTRRCIYSKSAQIVSTNDDDNRRTILDFEEDFPMMLQEGDGIESVIPFGEEHMRLLVLKTAWSCFEKTANIPAMKAIQPEMAEELKAFVEYVTPRDTFSPGMWHDPTLTRASVDQDRSPLRVIWR